MCCPVSCPDQYLHFPLLDHSIKSVSSAVPPIVLTHLKPPDCKLDPAPKYTPHSTSNLLVLNFGVIATHLIQLFL